MTATFQRAYAVRFSALDRWVVPTSLVCTEKLPGAWHVLRVGNLVSQVKDRVKVEPHTDYKMLGVKWYGKGTFHRETVRGDVMSARKVTPVVPGAFIYNRLFAWKASFAVVPTEHGDGFVSGEFPQFIVDEEQILAQYLYLYFTCPATLRAVNRDSVGSAAVSRNRFKEEAFLGYEIPLPPLATQRAILAEWRKARKSIAEAKERARKIEGEIEAQFFADLGLLAPRQEKAPKTFGVVWSDFLRWSVSYNQAALSGMDLTRGRFPVVELGSLLSLVQYGTSEKANSHGQGVPVLRINNIKERTLDLANLKHIDLSDRSRQGLLLRVGDILIIRTSGSRGLVGTCAVFHESSSYVFASYLIRMRTEPRKADPDFVSWFINSDLGRQQVNAISRHIMQNNINSQELRGLQIPLPPLDIQHRIMEKVTAGRAQITHERESAAKLARQIEADMEAYLLVTKKVGASLGAEDRRSLS